MKQIPLTQGKSTNVSDGRFDYLNQWDWHFSGGYAVRKEGSHSYRTTIMMHRVIMQASSGYEVDHIDGDGLNNQDDNLRLCTHAENQRNLKVRVGGTSKFKGVSYYKRCQKWEAQIRVDRKNKHLGYFSNEQDAARAYDEAARTYYGEFARTNTPD